MARSYKFTHAICRTPSASAVEGLRAVDRGAPDLTKLHEHHTAYVAALRSTGAEVTVLDPLDEFPDAVFVEDTALCLPQGAIALRPGAPTRQGEVAGMVPALKEAYVDVQQIKGSGYIEGGDILVTEREVLVGLSARTDQAGADELAKLVADWGHKTRIVQTPADVLHFKTDSSLLDEETILSTPRLAASGCFEGYRTLLTADEEEEAANLIRFNDLVIMADGFPRTAEMLSKAGYQVVEVGNSEAAKLDGGMSCLSLRLSPLG